MGLAVLVLVGMAVAFAAGVYVGIRDATAVSNEQWKQAAVSQRHAEFYIDHRHQRQWRWLPAQQGSEGE